MIDVGGTELSAHAECGVFLHCTGIITRCEAEYGRVVSAGDSDGDSLCRRGSVSRAAIVGRDHRVRESDGFTRTEEVEVLIAAVVPAVLVDRETGYQRRGHARIEHAGAPDDVVVSGLRHGHCVGVVQIGKAQGTAVTQGGRAVAFVHRSSAVDNRQRRLVVGAGNRNAHGLHRAVADYHVIGLGDALALAEELQCGVVHRKVPAKRTAARAGAVAQWVSGESAQIAGSTWRDADAMGVDQVDVSEGDAAAGRVVAAVFLGVAGLHAAGDLHLVVGAGDGDSYIPRCRRAMPIIEGDHIGFGSSLTLSQVLGCRIIQGVSPVNGAVCRVGRFTHWRKDEVAQRCGVASRSHERGGMCVAQVYIVKSNSACRIQRVGRAQRRSSLFGYRAGLCADAYCHSVIHASELHLRSGPAERAVAQTNRIGKAVCQGASGSKRLELCLESSRQRSGVVADLAIRRNPDLCPVETGVSTRRLNSAGVLDQEVGRRINLGGSRKTGRVIE